MDTFGTLFGFWRVVPTTAWLHWCTIGGGTGSPAPPAVAHNELNQHRRGLQWHNPGRRHRAASHADSTTVATLSLFLRPRPPCQRRWRRCDASRTHDAPTERHTPPSDSSYKCHSWGVYSPGPSFYIRRFCPTGTLVAGTLLPAGANTKDAVLTLLPFTRMEVLLGTVEAPTSPGVSHSHSVS